MVEENTEREERSPSWCSRAIVGVVSGILIVSALWRGGEGQLQLAAIEFLVLASVGCYLVWSSLRREWIWYRSPADVPLVLGTIAAILSVSLCQSRCLATEGLLEILAYICLVFIGIQYLGNTWIARWVGWLVIVLATFQGGYSIILKALGSSGRASGTMVYSTYLQAYLVMGICLVLGWAIYDRCRKWEWGVVFVSIGLMMGGFFLTGARAGVLSLLVGIGFLVAVKGRKWALWSIVLVIVVFIAMPNPVTERLVTAGRVDIYAYQRPQIWLQAVEVWSDRPLLGVGPRNFGSASRRYVFPVESAVGRYGRRAEVAHNQYLQTAADTGALGLISLLWFLFAFYRVVPRVVREARTGGGGLMLGSVAGLTAVWVHGLIDNPLYLPANAVAASLLSGMVLVSATRKHRVVVQSSKWMAGLLILLLIIGAYFTLRPALAALSFRNTRQEVDAGHLERALHWAEVASRLLPQSALYHDGIAKLHHGLYVMAGEQEHGELAAYHFQRAVSLNPLDFQYSENQARFCLACASGSSDPESWLHRAHEALDRAIGADPTNVFLYQEQAMLYRRLGDEHAAYALWQRIVELEPYYILAHYELGRSLEALGRHDEAREAYQQALSLDDESLRQRALSRYDHRLLDFDFGLAEEAIRQLEAKPLLSSS
jgi:O-antigen ligase/tetratricopeptide (TPR) repeat protein